MNAPTSTSTSSGPAGSYGLTGSRPTSETSGQMMRLNQELERINKEKETKVRECQELFKQLETAKLERDQLNVKNRELQQRLDSKGPAPANQV